MGATSIEDEIPQARQSSSDRTSSQQVDCPPSNSVVLPSPAAHVGLSQPDPIWDPLPVGVQEKHSEEDSQLLGFFLDNPFTMREAEHPTLGTNRDEKLYLQDHHVVLKELGCLTLATRLFKDHTRAIFPRSKAFDLNHLIALQNQCYRCRYPTKAQPSLQIYVSLSNASKHPSWATDLTAVRYGRKKEIAFVPASEECIRHEIGFNGGRSPQDRVQSKAAKKEKTGTTHKRFHEESLSNLHENLKLTCDQWIQESPDRFDQAYRQSMVEQFWKDFHKEEKLLGDHGLVSEALLVDGYDQMRQSAHNQLLVHVANELGNAMVDWYENQRGGAKRKSPSVTKN